MRGKRAWGSGRGNGRRGGGGRPSLANSSWGLDTGAEVACLKHTAFTFCQNLLLLLLRMKSIESKLLNKVTFKHVQAMLVNLLKIS